MSGGYALRASFVLAIAGVVASTSLAHAIDLRANAQPTAEQQLAAQVKEMASHVTRMEEQITKLNDDLIALRDQQSQLQPASRDEAPDAPDTQR